MSGKLQLERKLASFRFDFVQLRRKITVAMSVTVFVKVSCQRYSYGVALLELRINSFRESGVNFTKCCVLGLGI